MNTTWSDYIQGIPTLYESRRLRFSDAFAPQFKALFALDAEKPLKILEIGCGPGALCGALHRWYPQAEVMGLDRDSAFIRFAQEHEKRIRFLEGDAAALPFADNSFDVTISNTVAEHIEPSAFYGEQCRVLKPGGICLVLSSRKSISRKPPYMKDSAAEKAFREKADGYDDAIAAYEICKYPMSESELPAAMENYGFSDVAPGYAVVHLTPDHPAVSAKVAHEMINADCHGTLDAVDSAVHALPGQFSEEEIDAVKRSIHQKYDRRIAQYDRGEKQWDTLVSVIMVVRGRK